MNKTLTKVGITAACTAATMLLTICMGLFAPLAIVLSLCTSIFTAYLMVRCGYAASAINAVITAGAVLFLGGGQPETLLIAAMGVAPGLVSGFMQKKNFDYYASLLGVCLAFAAVLAGLLYMAGQSVPGGIPGIFDMTAASMKEYMVQLAAGPELAGMISAESISEAVDAAVAQTKMLMPSMIIIISMIMGYIHLMTVEFFVRKISGIKLNYVRFDSHNAPRHITYVYFVASIVLMFAETGGTLNVVLSNVTEIFSIILAFCGWSFIESKLKGKIRYGILRGLIYVGALITAGSLVMMLLPLVGMFDSITDYRGIRRNGE